MEAGWSQPSQWGLEKLQLLHSFYLGLRHFFIAHEASSIEKTLTVTLYVSFNTLVCLDSVYLFLDATPAIWVTSTQ